MKRAATIAALCLLAAQAARADVGVFTGNGQNLRQISSSTVQLVSIDVTILPGRGPFLFDGTVPGLDQVQYDCTFVLRNLSDKPQQIQVGFPIDSQFAESSDPKAAPQEQSRRWVMNYSFIARDEKATYNVDFVHLQKQDKGVRATFSWKMDFAARETRSLSVGYHLPISMTLATTRNPDAREFPDHKPWMDLLETGTLERLGYITETGSTWAGKVEKARFAVITEPFEKYLDHRGFLEQNLADLSPDERKTAEAFFPIHDAWWFRIPLPDAPKVEPHGLAWEYTDYKPHDPIEVGYFYTQWPQTPAETDKFLDSLLTRLDAKERKDSAKIVATVRQILLARWGSPPTDPTALAFASTQIWYHPDKSFSQDKLTPAQKTLLSAYDHKAATVKNAP